MPCAAGNSFRTIHRHGSGLHLRFARPCRGLALAISLPLLARLERSQQRMHASGWGFLTPDPGRRETAYTHRDLGNRHAVLAVPMSATAPMEEALLLQNPHVADSL